MTQVKKVKCLKCKGTGQVKDKTWDYITCPICKRFGNVEVKEK